MEEDEESEEDEEGKESESGEKDRGWREGSRRAIFNISV